MAEYLFEELARINVEVEYASEFRYRNPIIKENDIVIAISQSGETADTLAAIELAKSKGAIIFGVCNVVGSSIARATHAGAYTHAGPEIGVASTKAFTAQVTVLTIMALAAAQRKGTISEELYRQLLIELENIPDKVEQVLQSAAKIKEIAFIFTYARNFIYLGRGLNFPVALEGALKLKEISYIHAEGYPAAEMKHGPIALIDEDMPVVFLATKDSSYDKIVSNIQEVKARKGQGDCHRDRRRYADSDHGGFCDRDSQNARNADAAALGDSVAVALLLRGRHARAQRGSAAQSGEVGDGGVVFGVNGKKVNG